MNKEQGSPDMLKEYYQDEEEDMYWGEQQLELIETIGKQNFIYYFSI